MKAIVLSVVCLLVMLSSNPAKAFNACSTRAIKTTAEVKVSDGSNFSTESFFRSSDMAAIRHLRDDAQTVAVEGPLVWISRGAQTELGQDFHRTFALGHQYHAMLIYFEEIMRNLRPGINITFQNGKHHGISGDYPYGGTVHKIEGDIDSQALGFVFEFPDTPPMEVVFGDWREAGGRSLPFLVQIDDGTRVFEYFYTDVDMTAQSPLWFFEAVSRPGIDEVQIYRLHRQMLAAHCMGSADKMAELTAPEFVVIDKGEIHRSTREQLRQRFTDVFERVTYKEYDDLMAPIIEVSGAGDIGWIAVQVRTTGSGNESGELFDSQWAWVMFAKKIDGVWMNAGNAANQPR